MYRLNNIYVQTTVSLIKTYSAYQIKMGALTSIYIFNFYNHLDIFYLVIQTVYKNGVQTVTFYLFLYKDEGNLLVVFVIQQLFLFACYGNLWFDFILYLNINSYAYICR